MGISFLVGYSVAHIRDSAAVCGITGECFPTEIRMAVQLVRAQSLVHVGRGSGMMPSFLVGAFAGPRVGCSQRGECDGVLPIQLGPALGLEFWPGDARGPVFGRLTVYRSFTRTAAATVAESGTQKEYRPFVVEVSVGVNIG